MNKDFMDMSLEEFEQYADEMAKQDAEHGITKEDLVSYFGWDVTESIINSNYLRIAQTMIVPGKWLAFLFDMPDMIETDWALIPSVFDTKEEGSEYIENLESEGIGIVENDELEDPDFAEDEDPGFEIYVEYSLHPITEENVNSFRKKFIQHAIIVMRDIMIENARNSEDQSGDE